MQAKLATPAGKRTYSLRKETAEPVFGQMKDGRGLRRFRTRGLAKVRGEWALWCLTHNLRKLARVLRGQRSAARPALVRRVGARSPLRRWAPSLRLLELTTARSRPAATFAHPLLLIQTGSEAIPSPPASPRENRATRPWLSSPEQLSPEMRAIVARIDAA